MSSRSVSNNTIEPFNVEAHGDIVLMASIKGVDVDQKVEGAERFIGFGPTKRGYGQACILDLVATPHVAEPHVTWFPWTRPADRMVNFKWAIKMLGETRHVLLNVEKAHIALFEHFTKRGFLRKVGVIEDLPVVDEIHIYQYKRNVS